ncbi:hypothetical protein [Microbacterium azadirachtae]|uniref:Uncharacterized protein n=1 Tax=Microbacterium azadirachtae TaxID=582680 RepID=A0A1I6GAA0_9MICO|nr:hypothetical protein [Microbacterium azadirachtae]SDL39007.1 hypothetical protein SAMN04488593_0935 [Microbacterium azadirachtae]SEF69999.1 hypothetical protein SAMN04488594_0924 [Microbacterium azadirachtae]SEF70724.1 hypothetical protein SAMN04488592_0933 [Microbacterium azadirachtae]SFR39089.1 hypothetical protein SAMN04488591_0937 [Microbacterium azadirachtae]
MSKRARTKADTSVVVMVRMAVQDDGTLHVTVDGGPYLPAEFAPPWRRASYPHIVDAISDQRPGQTLRVDVIETDGRVITDYRVPPKPRRTAAAASPAPVPAQQHVSQAVEAAQAPPEPVQLRLAEFAGSGFVPGEDVAVAIVIAHTETGPDGLSRTLIDARYLDHAPTHEVILLGRISGTICIGQPT